MKCIRRSLLPTALLTLLGTSIAAPSSAGSSTAGSQTSQYRAPYRQIDPERTVPDDYGVLLRDGYTLEQHFEFLGQNLSETARDFRYFRSFNSYHAVLDSEFLHERVRSDPGVYLVEHDAYHDVENMLEWSDTSAPSNSAKPKDELK
jgi:hypothetical protein